VPEADTSGVDMGSGAGAGGIIGGVFEGIAVAVDNVIDNILKVQTAKAENICKEMYDVRLSRRSILVKRAKWLQRRAMVAQLLDLSVARARAGYGRPDARYVGAGTPWPTWIAQHRLTGHTPTWVRNRLPASGLTAPSSSSAGQPFTAGTAGGYYLTSGQLTGPQLRADWQEWSARLGRNVAPAQYSSARRKLAQLDEKLAQLDAKLSVLDPLVESGTRRCEERQAAELAARFPGRSSPDLGVGGAPRSSSGILLPAAIVVGLWWTSRRRR